MRKIRLKSTLNARLNDHLQRDLNDSQRAAVTAPDGYNLILAGPGSGKTRVITYRVAYLIATGVPAGSIMLVTFTRRAAREMVRRLERLIGEQASQVWAGTFHHIGNRLLRRAAPLLGYQPNFTILDGEDQLDLIRLAMDDAKLTGTGKMAPRPADVQHLISFSANVNRPIAEVVAERRPELVEWSKELAGGRRRPTPSASAPPTAWTTTTCSSSGAGLIREFPEQRELQGRMFRHILIDEMQDTNAVQVGVVEAIAAAGPGNLTAVGDDAQSIYRFRGADYDNILRFAERHPGGQDLPARDQLPLDAADRRLHPGLDRPQPDRVPQGAGLGTAQRRRFPWSSPPRMLTKKPRSSASRSSRSAKGACRSARSPCSIATITTASCSRASCCPAGFLTRCVAGCGSSSRRTSRTCWRTCGSWSTPATRRRGGGCCC